MSDRPKVLHRAQPRPRAARSLHRAHVDAFLSSAIPTIHGLLGLDIGCGIGARGYYRPATGQRWISIDLIAGECRGDIRALPFRSETFDILRATEMLYYLTPEQIGVAMEECRRVLTSHGRLVITAPLLVPPITNGDCLRLTARGWRAVLPFRRVVITPLGGYWSHLVTTLEHRSRAFRVLRPLARFDDGTYPHAYGIIAEP